MKDLFQVSSALSQAKRTEVGRIRRCGSTSFLVASCTSPQELIETSPVSCWRPGSAASTTGTFAGDGQAGHRKGLADAPSRKRGCDPG